MLVQTSNSFNKVFSSLSIVSENWGGINEWRSTLVRLREFERELYMDGARKGGRHRSSGSPDSGSETELLSAERPVIIRGGTDTWAARWAWGGASSSPFASCRQRLRSPRWHRQLRMHHHHLQRQSLPLPRRETSSEAFARCRRRGASDKRKRDRPLPASR